MGNAFDRIAQCVCEVIHGVDRPGVAGVLMFDVFNAVERWVPQVDVAASHVDFGTQGTCSVWKRAGAHLSE